MGKSVVPRPKEFLEPSKRFKKEVKDLPDRIKEKLKVALLDITSDKQLKPSYDLKKIHNRKDSRFGVKLTLGYRLVYRFFPPSDESPPPPAELITVDHRNSAYNP